MVKDERDFWKALKKNTEAWVFWTRIENLATPGIPDLFGVCNGVNTLVELKVAKDSQHISFEPTQLAWFAKYVSRGGQHCFIVVALPDAIEVYKPAAFVYPSGVTAEKRRQRIVVKPNAEPCIPQLPWLSGTWSRLIRGLFHQANPPVL